MIPIIIATIIKNATILLVIFIIPAESLLIAIKNSKSRAENSKYVFPNSKGEMYLGDNVFNRLFLPVRNACGIGHFTFKDLRHTFSTSLVTNGVDPKTVQKLMGHSSSVITLDVYTHSLQTSYKKVGDVLNNLYQLWWKFMAQNGTNQNNYWYNQKTIKILNIPQIHK